MTTEVVPELFENEATTPEKAWWLGVLLGDGNVYFSEATGDYRVSACGSASTTRRWLTLIAPSREPKAFKRSPNTFQAYVNSKVFVEYLQATYGLSGPKAQTLPWIDVPSDVFVHFARGLWDTDGSITIERRRHKKAQGNDIARARFGVDCRAFSEKFRDVLVERLGLPRSTVWRENGSWRFGWFGTHAMKIADWLYRDAPEHLRNEDRIVSYREMCTLRDSLDATACPTCGVPKAPTFKEGYCTKCWWALQPSKAQPKVSKPPRWPVLSEEERAAKKKRQDKEKRDRYYKKLQAHKIEVVCAYCSTTHHVLRPSYEHNIARNGQYICEAYGGYLAGSKSRAPKTS